jgi:acetyltransferase-like isoleucine patch superfamily enzyme
MGFSLTRFLSRQASRMKGSDFTIDERIGTGYLGTVLLERVFMKVRGFVRFPFRSSRPFIGAGVRIRSMNNLALGRGVTLGRHSFVDALSTDGVRLGDNVSLGRNTRIECTGSLRTLGKGLTVGDNVGLGTDCLYGCAGGVTIGADTIVGNFASFHAENHRIDDLDQPIRLQGVTHAGISIGRNCWIGAKATILDGARIGDGCVVAAGSVVIAGTYASNGIYGGIPAKLLKQRQ